MTKGSSLIETAAPPAYRAYLLRLWRVDSNGHWLWRASLQDPRTGERRGFADLAALGAFLTQQTNSAGEHPPPDS